VTFRGRRASGSRLFLALFGVSSLLLFGFLYWQTMSYLTNSVDDWLQRDAKGYLSAPADIARRLQGHAEHDPEGLRPFGLFDSQGRHLSGNLADLPLHPPPFNRMFEFTLQRNGHPGGVSRHRVSSGRRATFWS